LKTGVFLQNLDGDKVWLMMNMKAQLELAEPGYVFRKIFRLQLVCHDQIVRIAKSRIASPYLFKKNKIKFKFPKKENISLIFELESLFWCQKLRLEPLISDLFSKKI
jgi:hypothetical protein